MSILIGILTVLEVIVCLLLSLLILMQRPRQEGLGASFGGAMMDQFAGAHTTSVLQRGTVYFGIALFLLTFVLAMLTSRLDDHKSAAKLVNPSDIKPVPAETAPAPAPAAKDDKAATPAPATTTPAPAASATTEPAKPAETKPADAKLAEPAKPTPEAKPAETKPAAEAPKPAETKPATDAKPADTAPPVPPAPVNK